MKGLLAIWCMLVMCSMTTLAQSTIEPEPFVVDDIQIDIREVSVKGDSAVVDLFLISYKKNAREFKLNTFASGLVDSQGTPYLYKSMKMGRISVDVSHRQNYIHYLLEQDVPVSLRVVTPNWKKQWGKPRQVKLSFEDSEEEGKFLEVILDIS